MQMTPKVGSLGLSIPVYEPANGLAVITTYFNPCRYRTRRDNYDLFRQSMQRSEIPCITVECAFGDEPFELPETLDVIRVRSNSLLWQKERLLNLATSWLSPSYRYVAWLDCDILFTNRNWALDTARLLEEYPVVQMFETCVRLVRGNLLIKNPNRVTSFGAIVPRDRKILNAGHFKLHGHTGYGWAMRREIFDKVGLYEHAICGTADHFMAHTIYNDYDFCIRYALKDDKQQIKHLKEWGERFHTIAGENLTAVPGEILHLWHGDLVNRRYALRTHEITDLGYDPYLDVIANPGHPVEWHLETDKPQLKEYFCNYFMSRREDG